MKLGEVLSYIDIPESRFNKLVRQAHFVCYIEYFALSNMEKKHFFMEILIYTEV